MPVLLRITLTLLIACASKTALASSAPLGLWHWVDPGASAGRSLSIILENGQVRLKLDQQPVPVSQDGDKLTFKLDNGENFEGQITASKTLAGTWYQPQGQYFYSKVATQLEIPLLSNEWTEARFTLQPRPFHLFLDIFSGDEDKTYAVLRNPERNDILGATRFDVVATEVADSWLLVAGSGNRKRTVPITLTEGDLELEHFQVNDPVRFSPSTHAHLDRYYSRHSGSETTLSPVPELDDGWQVKSAAESGFDIDTLEQLVSMLANQDPRARRPEMLHSLLVSHRGNLMMEEYFFGHQRHEVHDSRSMAKGFGSVLIGAAKQNGFDLPIEQSPLPYVLANHDRKVTEADQQIKLEHFLTYTTGLDSSEDERSPGSEDRLWNQNENFWLFTALLEKKHKPGSVYAYSSASAHMVGAAIEQTVGISVREFFHQHLAKPLNFSEYHWNLTPDNTSYLGGGVYLTPRDALKLGALYSQNGSWYGEQIIPEDWVKNSTEAKIDISPTTTGLSEEDFSNIYFPGKQAYIWRVDEIISGEKQYSSYLASGNGGQMIVVVPELELAVGFMGGNYRMGYVWGRWPQKTIGEYLIPALVRSQSISP